MLFRRTCLMFAICYFLAHLFLISCATTDEEDAELAEENGTEENATEEGTEGEEGNQVADENENSNGEENNEFSNNEGDYAQNNNASLENFDDSNAEETADVTNQDLQQMINEAETETSSENEAPIEPIDENATALADNTATSNAVVENAEAAAPQVEPAPAEVATYSTPSLPEMGSKMPYIVQSGDTLESIAGRIYGNPSKWAEMKELSSLQNASIVHPGDVVYYQLTNETMAFASTYEGLPRSEIVVKQGDTLSGIAQQLTGDFANWKSIWRQNSDIENPDQISVGQTIYYVNSAALNAALNFVKNVKVADVLTINNSNDNLDNVTNTQSQTKSLKSSKKISQLSVKDVLNDLGFRLNFAS